jgi:hypothetical protein
MMKKFFWILGLALCVGSLGFSALAQTENLSAGRTFGMGLRFLPNMLYPAGPMETDQALGSVMTAQLWITETVALEAGGWMTGFSDEWSYRSFVNMTGGMIFKVSDGIRADLYIAGRGIRLESLSRNPGYCCPRCMTCVKEGETPPQQKEGDNEQPPIAKPWQGGYESRQSTLAFEGVAGMEFSLSQNMVLDFEFGIVCAQMMSVNIPPNPEEKPSTYSSRSFGMTLHLGLYYSFVPVATKQP